MNNNEYGENNCYREAKLEASPRFIISDELLTKAYRMSLENLLQINTVFCPLNEYNKTGLLEETPGFMIRAGGEYPTPWTRDAAVNTMNAACFIEPEVAKNTLWAVCESIDGQLYFQMDNQNWDKIIWAAGAWQYYLATGDVVFLEKAYRTVRNSLEMLEQSQFNEDYGLFTGGSFFNDGISGYPRDLHEEGNTSSFVGDHPAVKHVMTLSTNCLYYHAYTVLEKMSRILMCKGKEQRKIIQPQEFHEKALKLRVAINLHLWDTNKEKYAYLMYPDGRVDESQEACGISFAVLFGVCDEKRAKQLLADCYRSDSGIMSIWPPFEKISSVEKPLRHNNLIWPVVNGFYMTAAANCGLTEILKAELEGIARLAVASGGFYEIYNPETQKPDGGWQTGCQWDSVYDQTWSATGFIRGIVYGLFGINLTEDGIEFRPCLPKNLGNVELQGICFRNIELDISLFGSGSTIVSMVINKEEASKVLFSKPGRYCVEIWLDE